MLRTINEQILYIFVISSIRSQGEFKREWSTTLVFGCHQAAFNWCNDSSRNGRVSNAITAWLDKRSKEHIQSKYQREKENQRESPSAAANNEWNEVKNLLEHRPNDSWTWIHTNG